MKIGGLQKITLLDYPGKLACTIFTQGCNFKCPFCHNADLVTGENNLIEEQEVFDFLKSRTDKLEGVVISGGEPTIHKDLPEFISKIKELGYKVKLDTNGSRPVVLQYLIDHLLIDYVAMDIKSGFTNYGKAIGREDLVPILANVKASMYILKRYEELGIIDYELRTTVVDGLHTELDFLEIAEAIQGSKKYFIQSYVNSDNILEKDNNFCAPKKSALEWIEQLMSPFVKFVDIRGVG